jgi:hypothetical protein
MKTIQIKTDIHIAIKKAALEQGIKAYEVADAIFRQALKKPAKKKP